MRLKFQKVTDNMQKMLLLVTYPGICGYCPCKILITRAEKLFALNACFSVAISYNTQPNDHISLL